MAKFTEKSLRDEENSGRFNPGTPDDETFHLESIDAYPGNLPDYSDLEELESVSIEEKLEVKETEGDLPQDDTQQVDEVVSTEESQPAIMDDEESIIDEKAIVDDEIVVDDEPVVDDEIVVDEKESIDADEVAIVDDVPQDGTVWDLFDEKKGAEQKEEIATEDAKELKQEIVEEKQDVSGDILSEKDTAEPIEDDESINELREILEEDLAKSKEKKISEEKVDESSVPDKDIDFHAVEEKEEVEEIDLSGIDAERPSAFTLEDEIKEFIDEPLEDIEDSKSDTIDEDKSETQDEEKPKKEKKSLVLDWKKIRKTAFITAAAVVFLAFTAVFYIWGIQNDGLSKMFAGSNEEDSLLAHTDTQKIEKEVKHEEQIKEQESIHQDTITEDMQEGEHEEIVGEELTTAELVDSSDILDSNDVVEYDDNEKKVEITHKKVRKRKAKKERKRIFGFIETIPDVESYIKSKSSLYIVQVYASPSKEDADAWLKKLKQKNINDAFITIQKKREQDWYRVRFGAFKTQEEARDAAIKLGFAQSWIDRVR